MTNEEFETLLKSDLETVQNAAKDVSTEFLVKYLEKECESLLKLGHTSSLIIMREIIRRLKAVA